jgi:uncharacterized protein YecA (UPF0149 family)
MPDENPAGPSGPESPHKHSANCGCKPRVFSFKDVVRRPQQPNDKCACMSGKKFKKCCGRG